MCRNIRPLNNFEPPTTEGEIRDAATQYVRKIAGISRVSRVNEAAFRTAVDAVTAASRELLAGLETTAAPRNREIETEKAKARSAKRFATQ